MIAGKAVIVRAVYEGRTSTLLGDVDGTGVGEPRRDAGAFMDLSIILRCSAGPMGPPSPKWGAGTSRDYRIHQCDAGRVLVIVTRGDFIANTPIEFLLEGSDTSILLHYVDETTAALDNVPEHDVAFVAVSRSPDNRPVLENLERVLETWKGPILNNAPRAIIDLSREGVSEAFPGQAQHFGPAHKSDRARSCVISRMERVGSTRSTASPPFRSLSADEHACRSRHGKI